ncbi:MAG TPA: phage holin family protein [Candidatus Parabacteroides intestinavium]|nr:phage holin family protein [Candidatus Parabacteroides intestinavium]
MMKDSEKIFQNLKEDISAYINLKLELLKLNTYEKSGKIISLLSYGLILFFLVVFVILFIFLSLGFFLGDLLDNAAIGFGIISLLYLVLIGITVKKAQWIQTKVLNKVIATLITNEEQPNKEENDTSATDTH